MPECERLVRNDEYVRELYLDPNERKSTGRLMGDPRTVNDGPAGLARFCTLRSWLSQSNYTLSNTDGPRALAHVSVPVFMLDCGADDGCTPHHSERFWNAIGHAGKERCIIPGATRYFFGQKDKCDAAAAAITGWLAKKGGSAPELPITEFDQGSVNIAASAPAYRRISTLALAPASTRSWAATISSSA